ncbi:MAG TPA: hypothetical protein VFR26_08675 [Acidimicrobiales bacterium]|nr:hypothetical protein [Acidimicrobiales bacterium]
MRRALVAGLVLAALLMTGGPPAQAQQVSGAIFTTLADGSEVNFNIYPNKEAVYLDGGPGPGAPQDAAGLPDGTYVFQVTNRPARPCCRPTRRAAGSSRSAAASSPAWSPPGAST